MIQELFGQTLTRSGIVEFRYTRRPIQTDTKADSKSDGRGAPLKLFIIPILQPPLISRSPIACAATAIATTARSSANGWTFDPLWLRVSALLWRRLTFLRRFAAGTGGRRQGHISWRGSSLRLRRAGRGRRCDRLGGGRGERLRRAWPISQSFFELLCGGSQVAVGILHQERMKACGRICNDCIVPGEHPAMTIKPFTRLGAEWLLRVQADEGFV